MGLLWTAKHIHRIRGQGGGAHSPPSKLGTQSYVKVGSCLLMPSSLQYRILTSQFMLVSSTLKATHWDITYEIQCVETQINHKIHKNDIVSFSFISVVHTNQMTNDNT